MDFDLTSDQKKLQASVREFAESEVAPRAEALDREGVFPVDLFQSAGKHGIMSIPFKQELGGMGLGVLDMVLALEEIARADQSLAVSIMVSVATGLTVARYGQPDQISTYLPQIISGERICSIAGTEPHAGSDTAGFTTRATPTGNRWRINGEKAFITNAGTPISSFAMVLTVTSPPDAEKKSFSLFLVPKDAQGYTQGKAYSKLGWRSSDTRPLHLSDVDVGPENIIGGLDKGRYILHKGYQQARIFLAACSLGLAQACLDHSTKFAKERRAFGATIGRLQLVQELVANIALQVDIARLLTYRAALNFDVGREDLQQLSMAKLYACEAGTKCADLAIQVHGGWGYMDDCPVSRYYRDNRICTIGDGSSQVQTLLIAREQGLDVTFR